MTLQTANDGGASGGHLTKEGLETSAMQLKLLEEYVKDVLQEGGDYGVIPGTNSKPALLKPGAANVIGAFNCYGDPHIETETIDLDKGLIFYRVRVDVLRMDNGFRRAVGQGSCSSYEKKYRYRNALAECPNCHKENIRVSRGGGFYCWQKLGGCGATFVSDDGRITNQTIGQIIVDDPMEQANTILKMAIKRAEVDAALRLPGVARFFTQDLEDMATSDTRESPPRDVHQMPTPKPAPPQPTPGFCHGHRIKLGRHPTEGMVHKLPDGGWCHGISAESTPQPIAEDPPGQGVIFPDTPLGQLQKDVSETEMEWADFEANVLHNTWPEWVKLNGTINIARARWANWQEQQERQQQQEV